MSASDINEKLLAAAKSGDLDTVILCLESGATQRDVALNISADQGHLSIVHHILVNGVTQAEMDEALWYAAAVNHFHVVEFLVEAGADYSAKDNRVIIVAAEEDNLEVTQFFVERGANIDIIASYAGPDVQDWLESR